MPDNEELDEYVTQAAARGEELDMVRMLLTLTLAEYRVRNFIGKAKFDLGVIVTTPAAQAAVLQVRIIECLARHGSGEWGLMPEYDKQINERMLVEKGRVMSAWAIDPSLHASGSLNTFWIITDAPGVLTTILLPDDY